MVYGVPGRFPGDPGGSTGGTTGAVLDSVGTTAFNVYHPSSQQVDDQEDTEPQLQAEVTGAASGGSVTVEWFLGSTKVAEDSATLDPLEGDTLAERVSWSDLDAKGLTGGEYPLKAKLANTGDTTEYGSIRVHEAPETGGQQPPEDVDDGGGDDTTPPDPTSPDPKPAGLLPAGFPTLPAVGPLTAEQTTLGALVALVLLVVIGR